MELVLVGLVAIVIGPFVIGLWIGNPLFAAAVFGALALTVLLGAISRGDAGNDPGAGLALSLLISAASAAAGGHVGARRRTRRARRR